ncbi:MAG: acetylornithine deacetylase [Gammaproteobacteria bacterium]|jgi:acetylornithine deacetylase|nr:acetylornithine deacetylase [Gammaproteobacteria bacterium]
MTRHIPTKIPGISDLIKQLLSTPSVSCTSKDIDQGNLHVIQLLADWFESLGFDCNIQIVDQDADKANLIATLGSGNNGLVLAGHTDTVPFDEDRWQVEPFGLTEKENRFYGLGSCDMKSFFAVIIEALKTLDRNRFQQPLIVLATADEETSMSGAKAIARHASRLGINNARCAVVGEPTDMKPIRMHKGMMMEAIQLTGQAGHSSNPALGNNALEAMHKVISELMLWRDELQSRYHNPMFEVPVPTMNFGHIHGGDNPNRICGSCELQIDIRPLPGMKIDDLRHEMQLRLKQVLSETGIQFKTVALFDGVEAVETDKQSEIVRLAEKMTDTEAGAVAFGTEAPYYNALGLESIVMGPGSINQAHQPDEYIEMKMLDPAVDIIRRMIVHYCC